VNGERELPPANEPPFTLYRSLFTPSGLLFPPYVRPPPAARRASAPWARVRPGCAI